VVVNVAPDAPFWTVIMRFCEVVESIADVAIADGGTGLSAIADKTILVTSAANTLVALAVGAGQSIRRNAGDTAFEAYTPSTGGGLTWNEETTTSATMAVDNGYIANNASLVTLTLPTTAAVGKIVRVAGKGAGGWKIAQNASEVIHFLSTDTTIGTGGSISSTNSYDAIEIICTVADTEWTVISSVGNFSII